MTQKNKVSTKQPTPQRVETPTPEQIAKGNIIHNNKRYLAINQVPLDYYLNMKPGGINNTQFDAGDLLHKLFAKTGIMVPTTASMSPMIMGAQGDSVTESQVIARQRLRAAIRVVQGEVGRLMVENVCCYGYLLKEIPVPGYPRPNERMVRFRESLNDLVKHFHIPINSKDREYFYGELGWE